MITTKHYEAKRYDIKDFTGEGLKKIRKQIIKINAEAMMDESGVYSEEEYEFIRNQVYKLNTMEKILQVDDLESLKIIEDVAKSIANRNNEETIKNSFFLLTKTVLNESSELKDNGAVKTSLSILWNMIKKQGEGEYKKSSSTTK